MNYWAYEEIGHQWEPFPLYFLNPALDFKFLKESKFAEEKAIQNFILDDNGSVETFLRGLEGSKVLVSLTRYASPFIIVDIVVRLLSRFDYEFACSQIQAVDMDGGMALDYLLGYHLKVLNDIDYCEDNYLLLNLISSLLSRFIGELGWQQLIKLTASKTILKTLRKECKILQFKIDDDHPD